MSREKLPNGNFSRCSDRKSHKVTEREHLSQTEAERPSIGNSAAHTSSVHSSETWTLASTRCRAELPAPSRIKLGNLYIVEISIISGQLACALKAPLDRNASRHWCMNCGAFVSRLSHP